MAKDPAVLLRKRFTIHVLNKWIQNNHSLEDISCVYVLISFPIIFDLEKKIDIEYVGSTTKLKSRYRSHKIPEKIQNQHRLSLLYYLPIKTGFYDYEIKLIKKLSPNFNKQHKI